ncbi:putative mitochondrial protein [Trifolium repens]|nr:putative mitochondrial protein [Trifolium repens]
MPPRIAPPPPQDPSTDPTSPFYVHSSDGPSSVKVTPLLTSSNYHSWARSMRRALGAKLKFEFLDGSIPAPIDAFDPSYRSWNRCNMLIHSWIMNSVDPSIAQSIVFMENASDVWLDLKEQFSQGDLVRVSELQQEIYALTQDSRSVTAFYSDLKVLWEELEIYMPIPNCTCPIRCSCNAMRVARSNYHILHDMRFLPGLNADFNVVKSQILLLDPLPPMSKIFSMVLQFERQNCPPTLVDSKILVNASEGKSYANNRPSSSTSGSKRQCSYCHKPNHTVENCFKKHGVPPHMMCNYFGSAHNASADGGDVNVNPSASSNDSKGMNTAPSLTQEQYDKLLTLIQSSSISQGSIPATSNQVSSFQTVGPSSTGKQGIVTSIAQCHYSFICHNITLDTWMIDSGASHHICASLHWFHSYSEITPMIIKLPNGDHVTTKISGTIVFSPWLSITGVLYVPTFNVNLISVSLLCQDAQCLVKFTNTTCTFQDQKSLKMIGSAERRDGLYYLLQTNQTCASSNHSNLQLFPSANNACIPDSALWHFRLGHLSSSRLALLQSHFPFIHNNPNSVCDICHFAKHRKLPFVHSYHKANKFFDLIHFDIWGPISIKSVHHHSYFLTAVDDYSRYTWIILMKTKSEARQHVQNFIIFAETQHNCSVNSIRTDNGPEFIMPTYYASKGILHQSSCVETPQQNGRVERKHQQILNIGRALLIQSNLPKSFWSYAVSHAIYIMNRVPTPVLKNKSPYLLLYQVEPDMSSLKVFGSLAFASTLHSHRTKLDLRAKKCLFLGYKTGVKGVVLFDILNKTIFVSRDVTYHEHIFPYQSTSPKVPWDYNTSVVSSTPITIIHDSDVTLADKSLSSSCDPVPNSTTSEPTPVPVSPSSPTLTSHPTLASPSSTPPNTSPSDFVSPSSRPIRQRRAPLHLSDYVYNTFNSLFPSQETITSGTSKYPLSSFHSLTQLSSSHKAFSMAITHCTEPQSYEEASKNEHWVTAMKLELEALDKNCTWKIVELPPHTKPIGCRWVYKVKHKADGTIERYKARVVAKGYNQVEEINYFETFSPVAKLTTVRTLLAVAAAKSWHLHQLDVNNAFLHGDLQEDVYMKIPDGVPCDKPGLVCKLEKSLYGLKQASRKWYEKLSALLIKEGYIQSTSDYSLFTLTKENTFTVLLVYVDDIILAGDSIAEFDKIKAVLDVAFKIKNLGQLKYFFGLEVAHSKQGITVSQRKYCLDMLKDSGFLGSKPASTPLDTSIKLHSTAGSPYSDISSYRRLVGRLLYLNTTRPDIAFATQQLSQFMHAPTTVHYTAACRVLRYLKNNPGQGLFFSRESEMQLTGYSDADWAGCMDTRKSISGYCFFIGKSLISWRAKKQATVSRSSSEAEYKALSSAICELQWLLYLLADLRVTLARTPTLYCDNQSALHIASNPVFHERTKHLDIDCHLVREKVLKGVLKLLPVSTNDQMADFLSKALAPPKFHDFISKLSMVNIYHDKLEGGC